MSLKLNERYPGRFNNPSAGYPGGSFKNRTTPTAKDGSYLEKDWANDKEGFFQSLLSAAGITANGAVDAVGASQFFDALQALRQIQAGTAFTTTGSAGALTLAPTPAIPEYSAPLRLRVKFSQASTGTDTINVSGRGAKNIKQYSSTGAKVAAVFAANQLADVEYDGTDIVLLDQLPSTTQATEVVSGSMKIATLALVNGLVNDLTAVTPLKLGSGFSTTKAVNGYIKLPEWLGSLIIQWGWANVADDQNIDVTLPIAFPNTFYSAVATPQSTTATTGSGTFSASAFRKSLSIVQVGMNIGTGVGSTAAGVCWIAIGA